MAQKEDNKKKRSPKNRKKAMREGYLSFDIDEVKRLSESDSPNAEAYGYLYQAVTTQAGTAKGIDDAYPETAEETARMLELLNMAKKALVDKDDQYFKFCTVDLEMILDWSSTRHWNFQWQVILGVILTVAFLSWRVDQKQESVEHDQELVAEVENWEETDTVLNWDTTPDDLYSPAGFVNYAHLSAKNFKLLSLYEQKSYYASAVEAADEYAAKADTAQSRDVRKSLEDRRDESLEHAKECRKEFDRINKMDFKDIKKMALDEYGSWLKSSKAEKRAVRAWNIFFIILIPVYIFAERPYGYTITRRPYGYTITRTRAESSTLRGISKFTYALSAMMLGSAASISWIQTVRKYSDGHTERSYDAGTNAPVVMMKAALYIAAFALVCVVSCILMLYMTIQGLRRNYNWAPLLAKAKVAASSAASKAKKN